MRTALRPPVSLDHRSQVGTLFNTAVPAGSVILQPAWCQNCFRLTPSEKLKRGIGIKKYCAACSGSCLAQELEAVFLFAEAKAAGRKMQTPRTTLNDSHNRRPEPFGMKEEHGGERARVNKWHRRLTQLQLTVYIGIKDNKTYKQISAESGIAFGSVYQAAQSLRLKFSSPEFRDAVNLAIQTGLVEAILCERKPRTLKPELVH